MKLLHTSDLHLGIRPCHFDLLDEQRTVLWQMVDYAKAEQVDGVLICGDVYHRPTPPPEAMTLFSEFCTALSHAGIPVFAISGNHDSAERISCYSELLQSAGICLSHPFNGEMQMHMLRCKDEQACLCMLPFLRPADVRRFYPEEEILTFADAYRCVLSHTILPEVPRVLMAHAFVTGAAATGEEERAVGTADEVPPDLFSDFDYVALGHIHGPSSVGRDTLRYSGSPMKYSFAETLHRKSCTLVTLESGVITWRCLPLSAPRDMREVEGDLDQLLQMPYSEDYLRVTVTGESISPDARSLLLSVFPNMMRFAVSDPHGTALPEVDIRPEEEKSILNRFCEFYSEINGHELSPEGIAAMEALICKTEEESKEGNA